MNKEQKIVTDISRHERPPLTLFKRGPQPLPPEPRRYGRTILVSVLASVVLGTFLFYGFRGMQVRSLATDTLHQIRSQFEMTRQALLAFDIRSAENALVETKQSLFSLRSEASRFGLLSLAEVLSTVSSRIGAATDSLTALDELSDSVLSIVRTADTLKRKSFDWTMSGEGKLLIEGLENLNTEVEKLNEIVGELKHNAGEFDFEIGDEALAFRAELFKSSQLLNAATRWLSDTNHIALLFTNPSEIRPGGGFPGSYAALTIRKGSINDIVVRDIYDPDGQLEKLVVPPKQLQSITTTWGARDANWFFDFPTSARTTIAFLNDSKIYSEQEMQFSGLLMINVNVLADILDVTGPITLSEYNLTLDAQNVIDEIQREVRSGNDRNAGEPKRILKILAPTILNRLSALSETQKRDLFIRIKERFITKDMLAYLEDPVMEAYLEHLGIAGEVVQASTGDLNEYLAIANANIGGGKSDAVISQAVSLQSRIDLQGKIHNILEIKRAHRGKNSSSPWYNTTNKNFIQIFTPRGSEAVAIKGNEPLPVNSSSDFSGYEVNPDLAAIERSLETLTTLDISKTLAFHKTVFGVWSVVTPGSTEVIELQYGHQQKMNPNGKTAYQFIFEKQSGVETSLKLELHAPPGYKWSTNNSPTYTYSVKSAPGRVSLPLELIPIR